MDSRVHQTAPLKPGILLLLGAVLLLTLLLRLNFIHEPFDRDEGTYAVIGQEILKGSVPYRDVIEIKPPGAFYIFALMSLTVSSTESYRVQTALYCLVTVTVVFFLTRMIAGDRAGLLAALFCGIFTSGPVVQGSGSNTEVFMLLPLMAGTYYLLRSFEQRRNTDVPISGLCFALAVLIKTVALPAYLLAFMAVPFIPRGKDLRSRIAGTIAFILPGLLIALLVWGYLQSQGAWDAFIHWNYTFNRSYGQTTALEFISRLTTRGFATSKEFLLLWLVSIPTAVWILCKQRTAQHLFPVALAAAIFAGVCMPGKFWPHYFIPLIPILAVLSGVGLDSVMRCGKVAVTASLMFVLFAFWPTVAMDMPYYLASPDEVSRMKFGSSVFVEARDVARYVREHTTRDDMIFQWGWEPEIYATAGRRPANRFIAHLLVDGSPAPQRAVNDLADSILRIRPKYIIIQNGRESWTGYSALAQILPNCYHFEVAMGGYTLYRSNI